MAYKNSNLGYRISKSPGIKPGNSAYFREIKTLNFLKTGSVIKVSMKYMSKFDMRNKVNYNMNL